MSNFRSLTIQSGVLTQIQDSNTLIVGNGATTNTGNLTLSAAGTSVNLANPLVFNANQGLTVSSGTSAFDFSGGSGLFKTSTGAVTIGTGNITISGTPTLASVVMAASGTGGLDLSSGSGVFKTSTGTVTIGTGNVTISGSIVADINFSSANRNITMSAAAAETAGSNLVMTAGAGGATAGANPGGAGGLINQVGGTGGAGSASKAGGAGGASKITGGTGGAGSSAQAAGAGGNATIAAGGAGAANSGAGANGGNTTVDAGAATGSGTAGTITIGGTTASAIGIGQSGITTTITGGLTQLTGAVSLTGNGASSLTTSSGALTLTSAAAATWSTAAGVLTLNGTGGITLQGGGTSALVLNGSGTTLTIQAGATLTTTSTGMINLPTQFQINTASVSTNVTAANLNTLTAGSSSVANSLHTHTNITVGLIAISGLTTTGVGSGYCAYMSSTTTVSLTDNLTFAKSLFVGVNTGTSGSLQVSGLVTINFTTVGGAPTAGQQVWLAASTDEASAAGKATATCPSTTGTTVAEIGICVDPTLYSSGKTAVVLLAKVSPVTL